MCNAMVWLSSGSAMDVFSCHITDLYLSQIYTENHRDRSCKRSCERTDPGADRWGVAWSPMPFESDGGASCTSKPQESSVSRNASRGIFSRMFRVVPWIVAGSARVGRPHVQVRRWLQVVGIRPLYTPHARTGRPSSSREHSKASRATSKMASPELCVWWRAPELILNSLELTARRQRALPCPWYLVAKY